MSAASFTTWAIGLAVVAILWQLWEPQLSVQSQPVFAHVPIQVKDEAGAVARFTKGLQFATISNKQSPQHLTDIDAIKGLHAHITDSFPLVHQRLKRRTVRALGNT